MKNSCPGGGGGGAWLIGACTSSASITSLSEKHPKRGWSDGTHSWQLSEHYTARAHRGIASQISYPFRGSSAGLSEGSVNLIPFFHIFLFSIPLTRYARYAPGGEMDTLFTRFYWRGWCTGPNETCPPPPPGTPALRYLSHIGGCHFVKMGQNIYRYCQVVT